MMLLLCEMTDIWQNKKNYNPTCDTQLESSLCERYHLGVISKSSTIIVSRDYNELNIFSLTDCLFHETTIAYV